MREWLQILKDSWTFFSAVGMAFAIVATVTGWVLGPIHFAFMCPCHRTHDSRRLMDVAPADRLPRQVLPTTPGKD